MNNSFFQSPEEILEQGISLAKQQAQATAKAVGSQIVGSSTKPPQPSGDSTQNPQQPDASTKEFLQDMYGSSDKPAATQPASMQSQTLVQAITSQFTSHTPEDQEKIAKIRKELMEQHKSSYYEPLVARPKHEQEQEKKAEEVKQEEEKKRWKLEQKKEKDRPISVMMATNKAEQFRGAAG